MTHFFGFITGTWRKLGEWLLRLSHFKYRRTAIGVFVTMLFAGTFLCAGTTQAFDISGMLGDFAIDIVSAVSGLLLSLTQICIGLSIFALKMFIEVARYNNYIDTPTVQLGWLMVRDVANMFFVVALLLIAFGTILGIESYEYKKLLGKLIISSILINFSNTICQLIIDAAHVFTITFANAIMATAGGNLIKMFGLDNMMTMLTQGQSEGADMVLTIFAATLMSFMFSLLALLTIGVYMIVMIARMVILWALIILSPLAYILGVIPQTQSYASQWWDKFGKHVVVAPVMVFFLWLAFATMGTGNMIRSIGIVVDDTTLTEAAPMAVSISRVSTWENMSNFAVAVVFLFIGIQITQQLGVVGGSLLGSAVNFATSAVKIASGYALGRAAVRGAANLGKKAAVGTGRLGLAVTKGVAKNVPLVGGNAWKRRGTVIAGKAKDYKERFNMWRDSGAEALDRKGKEKGGIGKAWRWALSSAIQSGKFADKKAENWKDIGEEAAKQHENLLSTSSTKGGDRVLTMRVKTQKTEERKKVKGEQKYAEREQVLLGEKVDSKYAGDSEQMKEWQKTIMQAGIKADQIKVGLNQMKETQKGEQLRDWQRDPSTITDDEEKKDAEKFQGKEASIAKGKEALIMAQTAINQLQADRDRAGSKTEADMLLELKRLVAKNDRTVEETRRMADLQAFAVRQQKLAKTQAESSVYKDVVGQGDEGRRFKAQKDFVTSAEGVPLIGELDKVKAELAQDKFNYQKDRDLSEAKAKDEARFAKTGVKTTEYFDETNARYDKIREDRMLAGGFDKVKSRAGLFASEIVKMKKLIDDPSTSAEDRDRLNSQRSEAQKDLADLRVGAMARGQQFTGATRNEAFEALAGGDDIRLRLYKKVFSYTNEPTEKNLVKKQALELSSLLGELVVPTKAHVADAWSKLEALKGKAFTEHLVDSLNKEAEKGSAGDAGVFMINKDGKALPTDLTDPSGEGARYLDNKREWAISQAKYGGGEGVFGSMDYINGEFRIFSQKTQEMIGKMFSGLTSNNVGRVDQNVIESLVVALNNAKSSGERNSVYEVVFNNNVDSKALPLILNRLAESKKMNAAIKRELEGYIRAHIVP